jgi:DNA-binding NarL/FixJ family response regulator
MTQTRVLIADMPALARDVIMRIVEEQDDMTLVGMRSTTDGIGPEVARTDPDVVLVASLDTSVAVLRRFPWLRLIALDAIGGHDWFLEIRWCEPSSRAWPQRLVDAIRHPAHPPRNQGVRREGPA